MDSIFLHNYIHKGDSQDFQVAKLTGGFVSMSRLPCVSKAERENLNLMFFEANILCKGKEKEIIQFSCRHTVFSSALPFSQ